MKMQQEKAYEKFWSAELWVFGFIVLILLTAAFYWTAIRPEHIRQQCYNTALETTPNNGVNYINSLLANDANCIASKGLSVNATSDSGL